MLDDDDDDIYVNRKVQIAHAQIQQSTVGHNKYPTD